jgi:NarL family two-component system response regulator LiaR
MPPEVRPRIRVMIVDDHAVVRSGLSAFLSAFDDLELVAEAAGGAEAIRLCPLTNPDVVLMDLVMPGMDGATATREIRGRHPEIRVIAVTSFPEDDLVAPALRAGALSYLLKNVTAIDLAEAIRAAHAGQTTLAPEAAQALVRATTKADEAPAFTPRETEILRLLVDGLSNTEIASTLIVSRSTIKSHVSTILEKMGVSNRTEAATKAVKDRLV